jgi:hypothetical protein
MYKECHCQGNCSNSDWSWFKGPIYCISLRGTPDRALEAQSEFHRVGLCSRVIFYHPERDTTSRVVRPGTRGCWESHRALCVRTLDEGHNQCMIFEDDVKFTSNASEISTRVSQAYDTLPPHWDMFFLGHWPFWGVPRTTQLWRTRSGTTHAYVANSTMMSWLKSHSFDDMPVPRDGLFWKHAKHGLKGVDDYLGRMKNYAVMPMVAYQRGSPTTNPKIGMPAGKLIQTVLNPIGFQCAQVLAFAWIPSATVILFVVLIILIVRSSSSGRAQTGRKMQSARPVKQPWAMHVRV